MSVPRLCLRGVTKRFGAFTAVSDVSLDVRPGEVHALIGENGAGKSTLMHIVAGVHAPDAGQVEVDGIALRGGELAAARLGVAMVYQERSLVPALSVADNIFAGRQPANRLGIVRSGRMEAEARAILARLGVDVSPRAVVADLSPGQQQLVEIAKGLSRDLKVLILDEPTSSLTLRESRQLFAVVRRLAAEGVGIVYVSHRMSEILELSDRLTVLRDGCVTGVRDTRATTADEIIHLMVGRALSFEPDERRVPSGTAPMLEVEALSAHGVRRASLRVRPGEIVCLAGLLGAGRTELCEAIFGLRRPQAGRMTLGGRPFAPSSPAAAMEAGVSMLPEDRKDGGLFLDLSIEENVVAANLPAYAPAGLVSRIRVRAAALAQAQALRVAARAMDQPVRSLSGGNQQKVLLAKWLERRPRLLIVDEPTRGVDVGAKADIYRILRDLAAQGTAILVASSDLPEVLALGHRVVVMAGGRTLADMDGAEATESGIMAMAAAQAVNGEAVPA